MKRPKKIEIVPVPEPQEVRPIVLKDTDFLVFDGLNLTEKQVKFLKAYLAWGTQTRACFAVRESPLSVEKWKKENKDFLQAYDLVTKAIGDILEDKAIALAMRTDNDKLLVKLLSGFKPEKYGRKVEVSGPNGGAIPLTLAELARRVEDGQGQDSDGESQKETP